MATRKRVMERSGVSFGGAGGRLGKRGTGRRRAMRTVAAAAAPAPAPARSGFVRRATIDAARIVAAERRTGHRGGFDRSAAACVRAGGCAANTAVPFRSAVSPIEEDLIRRARSAEEAEDHPLDRAVEHVGEQ